MAQQSIVGFNDRPETTPMMTSRPGISVVYPMFNEEENIERAVHFAELVFYCDSDLPVDLTELNRAVRIMEFTRSDIVSAFRFDRTAEGPIRTVYSVCYNLLIRSLFPLRVKDVNFSFKLFKREVL